MQFFGVPFVVFGEDSLQHLETVKGKRAFIVTDENLVRSGLVDLVAARLKQAGFEYKIFDKVEPDPSIETVIKAKEIAQEFKPDWMIGLGGGSSMDTSKCTWICYATGLNPMDLSLSDYYNIRDTAHLICIPTTSGTGAEVTWATVLTDVKEERKLVCGSYETMPDVAILDPVMVMGMPPKITADTGMDALTHAIESYTTPWRTPFTDGPSLIAIDFIFRYLQKAYENGKDEESRKFMMYAASQAGTSICNCNGGLAHSAGHSTGGLFHTPHGRAVGLYLPYTMEYSANGAGKTVSRYANIARYCNISRDDNDEKCSKSLIAAVRKLAKSIGQPMSVKDLGIKQEDFQKNMDGLVDRAVNDAMTLGADRSPDNADMEKIFAYAYNGKSVDF